MYNIIHQQYFLRERTGEEDEDPGGFGSLVNAEPGGVEVRPEMNFKEKSQRSNDHNDIFSFLGEMPLGNSWVLASQI